LRASELPGELARLSGGHGASRPFARRHRVPGGIVQQRSGRGMRGRMGLCPEHLELHRVRRRHVEPRGFHAVHQVHTRHMEQHPGSHRPGSVPGMPARDVQLPARLSCAGLMPGLSPRPVGRSRRPSVRERMHCVCSRDLVVRRRRQQQRGVHAMWQRHMEWSRWCVVGDGLRAMLAWHLERSQRLPEPGQLYTVPQGHVERQGGRQVRGHMRRMRCWDVPARIGPGEPQCVHSLCAG